MAAEHSLAGLQDSAKQGKCPTCAQALDAATLDRLTSEAKQSTSSDVDSVRAEIRQLEEQLAVLSELRQVDETKWITNLFDDIEAAKVGIATQRAKLKDILEEMAEHNEDEFRIAKQEYERVISALEILDRGIRDNGKAIEESESQLRDVQRKLDKAGGISLQKERKKREVLVALGDLFARAVAEYRDRLRTRVEGDATVLFLKLTSEQDDAGLRINDQYGLTIVHKDGSDISVRSSGAEQIVALSLMGALQKNAPLKGPLIADSLLIRIDDAHRDNLVRTLPSMADQVMLLVFEAEPGAPAQARARLGASLLSESELIRVTAKHTDIEPFRMANHG